MPFKKKVVQQDDIDDIDEIEDEETLSLKEKAEVKGDKTNRFKKVTPIVISQRVHDPIADWEVDHSGTDDPDGGPPKYDESPVKGGFILATNYLHARKGELVNSEGFEIDPDDQSGPKGTAIVIDPNRYTDKEPDIH